VRKEGGGSVRRTRAKPPRQPRAKTIFRYIAPFKLKGKKYKRPIWAFYMLLKVVMSLGFKEYLIKDK